MFKQLTIMFWSTYNVFNNNLSSIYTNCSNTSVKSQNGTKHYHTPQPYKIGLTTIVIILMKQETDESLGIL